MVLEGVQRIIIEHLLPMSELGNIDLLLIAHANIIIVKRDLLYEENYKTD